MANKWAMTKLNDTGMNNQRASCVESRPRAVTKKPSLSFDAYYHSPDLFLPYMLKNLRHGWWTVALAAVICLSGCKKKASEAVMPKPVQADAAATTTAPSPVTKSQNLGFASHLPATTEAYFSTVNLPSHYAALKDSNYFKDVNAFMDDRVPAPAEGTAKPAKPSAVGPEAAKKKAIQDLLGDDVFIAFGKGSAKSMTALQQFSALYNEAMYHSLMAGKKLGAAPGPATAPAAKNDMIVSLLNDPVFSGRVVDLISGMEVPSVMIGMKCAKPEALLKELLHEEALAALRKKAKVSKVSTTLQGQFTLIEAAAKDSWNNEDFKKTWVAALPKEATAVIPQVDKMLAALQTKTLTMSYGSAGGYVIFTIGSTRPDLQFVTDESVSLAARPELTALNPFLGKNTMGACYVERAFLQALQPKEHLQPILRGLVGGLKESPLFAGLAKTLEPKLESLGELEHKMYAKEVTTLVGTAWWDKGLHFEMDGGVSPKGMEGDKPLKFASLVDDPNVILASDYYGNAQAAAEARAYFEGFADVIRVAAKELAKANLFGEQGPKMAEWIELEILPQITTFYGAAKAIYANGVGDEHALVIDFGGILPALPGMPPRDPKSEAKMVRFAQVNDVQDRAPFGENWTKMETSLNGIAKAFPMLAGQKLPEVDISNKSGVTCYYYPSPFDSDDLMISSAVSDKMFIIGTSRSLEEDIASKMLRAAPSTDKSAMIWRLNWAKVREALKTYSPEATAVPATDNLKAASKWLAPFGEMRGRMWIQAGRVRNSMSWEIKDTKKFD